MLAASTLLPWYTETTQGDLPDGIGHVRYEYHLGHYEGQSDEVLFDSDGDGVLDSDKSGAYMYRSKPNEENTTIGLAEFHKSGGWEGEHRDGGRPLSLMLFEFVGILVFISILMVSMLTILFLFTLKKQIGVRIITIIGLLTAVVCILTPAVFAIFLPSAFDADAKGIYEAEIGSSTGYKHKAPSSFFWGWESDYPQAGVETIWGAGPGWYLTLFACILMALAFMLMTAEEFILFHGLDISGDEVAESSKRSHKSHESSKGNNENSLKGNNNGQKTCMLAAFLLCAVFIAGGAACAQWKDYPHDSGPFSFPEDEGAHPESTIEWCYVAGHLTDGEGNVYGFAATFFENNAFFLSFTDEGNREHITYDDRLFVSFEEGRMGVTALRGFIRQLQNQPFTYHLNIDTGDVRMNLTLDAKKPPLPINTEGLIYMDAGNWTYYYSMTDLVTNGSLTLRGEEKQVNGISWLDRQWGSLKAVPSWEWWALQLDSGVEIWIGRIFNPVTGNVIWTHADIMYSDHSTVGSDELTIHNLDYWESPDSHIRYSHGWKVSIPGEGIELTITPSLLNQEMFSQDANVINFWEGSCSVSGKIHDTEVSGRAYAELFIDYGEEPGLSWLPGLLQLLVVAAVISGITEHTVKGGGAGAKTPKLGERYLNIGEKMYLKGEHERALVFYDRALSLDPSDVRIWTGKGEILHDLGRHREALDCYDMALELSPENTEARYNKGDVLLDMGMRSDAVECFRKVIEMEPEHEFADDMKKVISDTENHGG
ncbi:MAG: tetratricopeptide repeat protein [Thermoplasmata archaeon]|nr:MAG: tetratricopeptide repeat protein [Thermoplasmata archaeon]